MIMVLIKHFTTCACSTPDEYYAVVESLKDIKTVVKNRSRQLTDGLWDGIQLTNQVGLYEGVKDVSLDPKKWTKVAECEQSTHKYNREHYIWIYARPLVLGEPVNAYN